MGIKTGASTLVKRGDQPAFQNLEKISGWNLKEIWGKLSKGEVAGERLEGNRAG